MKQSPKWYFGFHFRGQNVPPWLIIMLFLLIPLVADSSLDQIGQIVTTVLPFVK